MPFRVEVSAASISDGAHGAVWLLLLKCSPKAIDAGIAAHRERAGAVPHGILIGEIQGRWSGEFLEQVSHNGLHGRREQNIDAHLEEGDDRSNPFGRMSEERSVARKAAQERAKLLKKSRGMTRRVKADTFSTFGRPPAGEID